MLSLSELYPKAKAAGDKLRMSDHTISNVITQSSKTPLYASGVMVLYLWSLLQHKSKFFLKIFSNKSLKLRQQTHTCWWLWKKRWKSKNPIYAASSKFIGIPGKNCQRIFYFSRKTSRWWPEMILLFFFFPLEWKWIIIIFFLFKHQENQ